MTAVLGALRGCVLLAGGLKPSPLVAQSGVATLDFTLTLGGTLMDFWMGWISRLRDCAEVNEVAVSVVHGKELPAPTSPIPPISPIVLTPPAASADWEGLIVGVRCEPRTYRGPAGVVRDVCLSSDGADEDVFFIADAGRMLACDLALLWTAHVHEGADVTVVREASGAPSGLYLANRRSLAEIQRDGFQDIKEQWLPKVMKKGMQVRVYTFKPPAGTVAMRTREDVLSIAQRLFRESQPAGEEVAGRLATAHDEAIRWCDVGVRLGPDNKRAGLVIIESEAAVSDEAVLVDTIVMPGAIVERGAIVARSLVCPKGRVEAGARVVDAIVGRNGVVCSAGVDAGAMIRR